MKSRKYNTKNLTIPSRVALTAVAGILLSVLLIGSVALSFRLILPHFFNVANVTTNSYTLINQIQLSQATNSISYELFSDKPDDQKLKALDDITDSMSQLGTKVYISRNNEDFYTNSSKNKTLAEAQKIVNISSHDSINYFGENGMVIVSHIENNNYKYEIIMANKGYTVNDVSSRYTPQDFTTMLFSKTGIVILAIFIVSIFSILLMSFITSKTITKPIKMLSEGANQIAGGNLDYVIDYDSTNEIGTTVKSMNHMTKRLKESLEHQKAIEQSRKELMAGVAHDLRTPLTSVKGYVEGLRDGIANTPEKQRQYLQTIYSSTLDMEKLLNELLNVSKLELGNIQLEKDSIDFCDFIGEYTEEAQLKLEKNDFQINFTPPNTNERIIVDVDTDRFSRVLTNIISNSVKYASKARKGKIDITISVYDKSIILSMADNGIGISDDNIVHIFDTFYRADQARTRVSDGSGLGLAVCKEIVELHNGTIWATSEEGNGTTILIQLPRVTEE